MKIYTRTGDNGQTGLIGGRRVAKNDLRLECYGTIDELNAVLGLAIVSADPASKALLGPVQEMLFALGSHLATPIDDPKAARYLPTLDVDAPERLERQIDAAEYELPELRTFILPGGTETSARLHLARTVCRRAERLLVAFAATEPVDALVMRYFNRLSDWLFVHARLANHRAGVVDVPWKGSSGA